MICTKCNHEQPDDRLECARCGIVFAKYEAVMARRAAMASGNVEDDGEVQGVGAWILDRALYVDAPVNPFYFGGRLVVFVGIVIWGLYFIISPLHADFAGRSFMHLINLPFHEAGHVFFRPFGVLLMFAGGSIMQILVPLICLGAFFWQKNPFGASACLWWTGESLMDLAPYIGDARALKLTLVGGFTGPEAVGRHDWNFILAELGLLHQDRLFAQIVDKTGIVIMLAAFAWGGYLLLDQYRNLDRGG